MTTGRDRRAAGLFASAASHAARLSFPRGWLSCAICGPRQRGSLPPVCQHAWIDTGIAADEAFVKLMVPLSPGWLEESPAICRQAQDVQSAVVRFLRQRPEF